MQMALLFFDFGSKKKTTKQYTYNLRKVEKKNVFNSTCFKSSLKIYVLYNLDKFAVQNMFDL